MLAYYAKWIPCFSEKIRPLVPATEFTLPSDAISAFEILRNDLLKARLDSMDESAPFTVECNASDYAIGGFHVTSHANFWRENSAKSELAE